MTLTSKFMLKLSAARQALDGKLIANSKAGVGGGKSIDYLDLPGLLEAVHPVLEEHGISLRTAVDFDSASGYNVVQVYLQFTETGEYTRSQLGFSPDTSPRDAGSAITYYMRYAILAALTQRAGKDDDAESVAAPKPALGTRRTLPQRGQR